MDAKTVVITGATSGIGEVAAIHLAEQGARIVFTARDWNRAADTLAKLRKANSDVLHSVHMADLSSLAEMKRVGREIAREPKIDVLINNAGAMFSKREETADGLEKTFALNHMSYFVITKLLLFRLEPKGRIVNTASHAHKGATLDFSDLQSRKSYRGFNVYSKSKLCNILFTRELARHLPHGVTANALHPGFVATRFGDNNRGFMRTALRIAKPIGAISAEEGAKTIMHLAVSADVEGVNGEYFYESKTARPSAEALKDEDAKRLWEMSEAIANVDH